MIALLSHLELKLNMRVSRDAPVDYLGVRFLPVSLKWRPSYHLTAIRINSSWQYENFFSVAVGQLTQNLQVIKWHLCFKFSGFLTVSTAGSVPLWASAPLEPQSLKLWISEAHTLLLVPESDSEKAHFWFRSWVARIFTAFFFSLFHRKTVIPNAAIAIKVLFNLLNRMVF